MDKNHQDLANDKPVTTEDKLWLPPSFTDNKAHAAPTPKKRGTKWGFADKSVWDWCILFFTFLSALGTIVIPIVLFKIGSDITQQQAEDQQRAAILQTYFDNIQDLLLNRNLRNSKSSDEVAILARERTLTALQGLDTIRKGRLLIFLDQAKLIGFEDTNLNRHTAIIVLDGADLRGAYLRGAILIGADLEGADLEGANLEGAILYRTNLYRAILIGADLRDAHLDGADLRDAHLDGAFYLAQQQLDQVSTCRGATLPQGITCHHN